MQPNTRTSKDLDAVLLTSPLFTAGDAQGTELRADGGRRGRVLSEGGGGRRGGVQQELPRVGQQLGRRGPSALAGVQTG